MMNFLSTLEEFMALVTRLATILEGLLDYAHQNNLNAWMDQVEKQIDALNTAKTQEDRFSALQNMVGSIRNIGPH